MFFLRYTTEKLKLFFMAKRLCRKLFICGNYQSFMIDNIMIFRSAAEKNPHSLSIVLCPLSSLKTYLLLLLSFLFLFAIYTSSPMPIASPAPIPITKL